MSDNIATLLQRMTNEKPSDGVKFDDDQVRALVEMILPKVATSTPGLPPGMKAEFIERGPKHWILRIDRP